MIYNVILNPVNRSNTNALDDISRSQYYFDWTTIPEGTYELSFTFSSNSVNQTRVNFVPCLHVNLGQSHTFKTDPVRVQSKTTNQIGIAIPFASAANTSTLYADQNINHPLTIQRPSSNSFNVDILTSEAVPRTWFDNDNAALGGYVLTLSLESK